LCSMVMRNGGRVMVQAEDAVWASRATVCALSRAGSRCGRR
jgi:hypothetical protein